MSQKAAALPPVSVVSCGGNFSLSVRVSLLAVLQKQFPARRCSKPFGFSFAVPLLFMAFSCPVRHTLHFWHSRMAVRTNSPADAVPVFLLSCSCGVRFVLAL